MRNSFLTLVLFLSSLVSQAQSSSILSLSEYLGMVKTHHPISKTAQLYVEMAKANVQSSRGAFDPKLFYESYQKDFDSKTYYDLLNAGFKVPTWFGIELSGGYEINQGLFLNPENTTTNSGLLMAGISLPLGKGLFIDERRAELKKAKLMLNMNEIERRVVLNELMYEASKAYWDWFESIEKLKVYQETLQLAQDRLRAIKSSVEFGDRPGIDTVEAGIQVQNWQLGVQEVSMEYENAKAKLAVYLWAEGLVPLELSDAIVPETFTSAEIQLNSGLLEQSLPLDSLVQAHPILQQYGFKIDAIKVEQRWKREQLKPDVRIKYNPLFEPVDDAFLPQYNVDNYQLGVSVAFPLLLRKERGSLSITKYKLNQTQLDLSVKNAQIKAKANIALNRLRTTHAQFLLYKTTVADYLRMLESERTLFNTGESSIFLVNTREMSYINARLKLIELLSKNRILEQELKTQLLLEE